MYVYVHAPSVPKWRNTAYVPQNAVAAPTHPAHRGRYFETFNMCVGKHSRGTAVTWEPQQHPEGAIYCNATCDGYLCWPPTPAGQTFFQNCPKGLLSNEKMCAFRRCGPGGLWLGRHLNDTSPKGWTNYTPCFPELVQKILDKVNEDEAEAQLKFKTAVNTRTIEMVGIASSFLTISTAIIIFNAFPSLHNRRTVIHRHLFYALLMEVTVRMVLYTQQSYSFDDVDPLNENTRKGIEYFPYVCEGTFVILEYSRLVVYGWMFIEGIFLNTLISANTLRNEIPIIYFYVGGWGVPAIVIAIWATVVGRHYSQEPLNTCWYGYNYLPSYYIIQGPILAIVLINMLFLGTIMSVIIMKLRRTNDSELRKIQKTIRATLILLPLLGIINIFNLFDYPLDGSSTGFAIWAYFTHFFRSFQGVFISFIYCFSNGEVRKTIKKKFERRTWCRFERFDRHGRTLPAVNHPEPAVFAILDNENMELVPIPEDLRVRTWPRPSITHLMSDIEAGPSQANMASDDKTLPATPPRPRLQSISTYNIELQISQPPESSSYEFPEVSVHLPDNDQAQLTSIKLNLKTSEVAPEEAPDGHREDDNNLTPLPDAIPVPKKLHIFEEKNGHQRRASYESTPRYENLVLPCPRRYSEGQSRNEAFNKELIQRRQRSASYESTRRRENQDVLPCPRRSSEEDSRTHRNEAVKKASMHSSRSYGNIPKVRQIIDPDCPVHNPRHQRSASCEPRRTSYEASMQPHYESLQRGLPCPHQRSASCEPRRTSYEASMQPHYENLQRGLPCPRRTSYEASMQPHYENLEPGLPCARPSRIEPLHIYEPIPVFDRPPARRPSNAKLSCCCPTFSTRRSSSFSPPARPRRARNAPFVRPGLVTRDSRPRGAMSECGFL